MTARPEQEVIDAIDALIDEQLAGGEYAAIEHTEAVVADRDRCKLCGGAWHGSPWMGVDRDHLGEYDRHNHGRAMRCPGAFATGPQRIRYRWHKRQRSVMQGWMGRRQDPWQRYLRSLQNTYNTIKLLLGEDLVPWQRERLASLYTEATPGLPPVVQFPRQYGHPNRLVSIPEGFQEVGFIAEDDITLHSPAQWRDWDGESLRYTAQAGNPTIPKVYMIPSRHGRESVMRRDAGRALLCYWGSPQVQGLWWELDPSELPWAELELTHEQDRPREFRTGRESLPPLQRVFIELTAASGLHVNPIGLIAVGHGGPGASGTVRRAYLKSLGDHPPLLYDDERRTSAWQPTLWRWRGDRRTRPERLVDAIRGAEGL